MQMTEFQGQNHAQIFTIDVFLNFKKLLTTSSITPLTILTQNKDYQKVLIYFLYSNFTSL